MQGKITASSLNVRKATSTASPVIKTLTRGTVINILDNKKVGTTVWYKIKDGWISGKYVDIITENKNEIIVNPSMTMKQIQDCLKESGCTIRFISGVYNITTTLYLYSNTKIIFDDGVIIKRMKKCYLLMTYVNSNTTGYNGEKNITISGGTIIADGHKGITNIINIVHAQNVKVNNLTIKNNVGCHAIEINASKDVTIQKCVFDGNHIDKKNTYREAIQIDFSFAVGLAYVTNKLAKTYDNTHCKNIVISDNVFKGYNVIAGTHTQTRISKEKHNGIKIINNTCNGVGAIGGHGSCFRIVNMNDVLIDNNTISGFARGIEVTTAKRFYYTDGRVVTSKPNGVIGSTNITITRNMIKQPSKDYKASGIYITSHFDNLIHDNILIENNILKIKNDVSKYDVFYNNATNVKEKNNKSDL